jgi:hypothetical protein
VFVTAQPLLLQPSLMLASKARANLSGEISSSTL